MRSSIHARTKTAVLWSARAWLLLVALAGVPLGLLMAAPGAAFAQEGLDEPATRVDTEAELRTAWADLTETHIGLTDDILDQLAKFERAKTAERSRRGKLRKAREGKVIASHTPNYGFKYNATRDGYEVDGEAMQVVQNIFRMISEDDLLPGN